MTEKSHISTRKKKKGKKRNQTNILHTQATYYAHKQQLHQLRNIVSQPQWLRKVSNMYIHTCSSSFLHPSLLPSLPLPLPLPSFFPLPLLLSVPLSLPQSWLGRRSWRTTSSSSSSTQSSSVEFSLPWTIPLERPGTSVWTP